MPLPPYFGQLDNTTTTTADLKVLRCQGLRDFLVGCVRESLPVTPKQRRRRAQKIFCSSRRFFPFFLLCAPSLSPSCTFRRFGTRRRKKRTSQRGNKSRSKIFILYAKARAWMLFSPLLPSISSSNGRMVKMCPPSSLSHTHGRSIRSHILGRQIWGKSPTDRLAEYYISPPLPSSKNGEIRGQFVFPGRVGRSKVPCCGSISFSEHGETRCFPTEEGSSSRFVIRLSQSTQNIYLPRQQPF